MTKKILLVDDEAELLKIIKAKINSWGYEVITASNGKEAMEAFSANKVGAVILDYLMPDIDGIELLKKIRTKDEKIPAIMFTAYPEEKSMEDAEKLKITAFIPKMSPYTNTIDSLKATLEMVFKKRITNDVEKDIIS